MLRKIKFSPSFMAAFYIGAGLGPQTANISQDAHIFQPGSFDTRDKHYRSGNGYFASVLAGYGLFLMGPDLVTQNMYLGAELNANASSLEYNASNKEFIRHTFSTTTYKMNRSFGLSFLPGFLMTETTLFYGRLGYALGSFQIETTDVSAKNTNKNLDGLCLGLGIRQYFWQHLALFLEYSQTNYQGLKIRVLSTNNTTKVTNLTPTTSQGELGLLYNFN